MDYADHLRPIWRERANFIIHGRIEDAPQGEKQQEQLWVRQVAPNEFEVCCIPFFLYNISLGDYVKTAPLGEPYIVHEVTKRSPWLVYRVWFGKRPADV